MQLALSITGGGISSDGAGTTAGTSLGLQRAGSATAGPVIGLAGTSYQIHGRAASGALANYSITASCLDAGNSAVPIPLTPTGPGAATDFSLVFPAASSSAATAVSCTFKDTPLAAPVITLTKAIATARMADRDQFSLAIHAGSATGPIVSSAAHATTSGSGSTVTPGSGTTGPFIASAGRTYYLTEAAAGTTDLRAYSATISCADAAGLQIGLPHGVPFAGSLAISPGNGAVISCVLTNGRPGFSISASATPVVALPGTTVFRTLTVLNTGTDAYAADTASFRDDLSGVLDDARLDPA